MKYTFGTLAYIQPGESLAQLRRDINKALEPLHYKATLKCVGGIDNMRDIEIRIRLNTANYESRHTLYEEAWKVFDIVGNYTDSQVFNVWDGRVVLFTEER